MTPRAFRKLVLTHYKTQGRHSLLWRTTHDPYKILVSEVMLQQTQVDRVIPFYTEWLANYPTVTALSQASLADVLRAWQGLGYNRRAKMLWEAARVVVKEHGGKMPRSVEALEALPGVGPYTARAVAAFAYNQPVVFIETNLRTAATHHFFKNTEAVKDADIMDQLKRALPKKDVDAREWYSALMDYGAFLKRSGIRVNAQSATYTKQKAFKGSGREVRGAILRSLLEASLTATALAKLFPPERSEQVHKQLAALMREELILKTGQWFSLPR